METWEYRTVTLSSPHDWDAQLNALGRDGWELVALTALAPNLAFAVFKRRTAAG